MQGFKKAVSILLSVMMAAGVVTIMPFGANAKDAAQEVSLKDGTYAPNQAVVLFRDSAIDTATTTKKGAVEAVGASFGDMMDASSSGTEALSAADEEINILKSSLGSDFVLEDTLVFDDSDSAKDGGKAGASVGSGSTGGLTIGLVSSEQYDTKTLIEKLGKNKNVVKVEPNYYFKQTALDDYSLNDEYSSYLYDVNSPAAKNTGGDSVEDRGTDAATALSLNASTGWKKVADADKETVVAVIDDGVFDTHEDLKDVMWTNPGNIGLKGKHGYDFAYNSDKSGYDETGHGTHCAGIIAAQANNAKGVAGIASGANVKIMSLKIMSGGATTSTAYATYGAFNYIHKAVQGGVNVVAVNNSWAGYSYSDIYDVVIDQLGEDGVVSYLAASNDGENNDDFMVTPANTDSEYAITVGAADITGKRAAFSNYGKTSVDIFGAGVNILSTVGYKTYFPTIYRAEKLNATTEYYGEFNADTKVENGKITPSKGSKADADVKQFGEIKFAKQKMSEENEAEIADDARLELAVEQGRHFITGNPYRLKVTVKDAQPGEEYYIYFPYEKNALTTGDDNTYFSVSAEAVPSPTGGNTAFYCGEVSKVGDSRYAMTGRKSEDVPGGSLLARTTALYDKIERHATNILTPSAAKSGDVSAKLLSADEADGKELGFGLYVAGKWSEGTHDLSIYIDNLAVSKPGADLDANTSYDVMSGTSMACPSVCGGGALIAALYPRQEGESGSAYSKRIRSKVLSCVTQTDELKDYCSTGGYLDLTKLDAAVPAVTDAVCDMVNETITLKGENLFGTLTYRSLSSNDAEEKPLPDSVDVDYSDDGKQLVIRNAKSLFSTYTEFTVTTETGAKGTGKFFLVKGQNQLLPVSSELKVVKNVFVQSGSDMIGETEALLPPYLMTDAGGKALYGYYGKTGEIAKFDGEQFNTIKGSEPIESLRGYLSDSGVDAFTVYNDYQICFVTGDIPAIENGVIYEPVQAYNKDMTEAEDSWYLASFDLNEVNPQWCYTGIEELPGGIDIDDRSNMMNLAVCDGKLYIVCSAAGSEAANSLCVYSLDIATKKWAREADLPFAAENYDLVASNGKLYAMFGTLSDKSLSTQDRILNSVYCYDGGKWEKKSDVALVGRVLSENSELTSGEAVTSVKNGLLFAGTSVDGGGNVFLYNTNTDKVEPLYYTTSDSLSDTCGVYGSCVATCDGVYYIRQIKDDCKQGWSLSLLPESSGAYLSPFADVILGDADGDGKVTISDATLIQKYLAGLKMPGSFDIKAADTDGSGSITIDDVTQIQRYLSGLSSAEGIGYTESEAKALSLWTNNAPLKSELTQYMKAITDKNSADYIPVEARIAVFDMDGTLCCETDPGYFDHKLLYHRVMEDPDYKDKASDEEKEVCADIKTYFDTGVYPKGMDVRHGKAVATAFKGMTPAEFDAYVKAYRDEPMESYTNMTNGQAFYKPMLQVIDYLQANQFKVYIVSGTDRLITRGLAEGVVNIPLAQMIGSDESLVATGQGDTDGLSYTYTHDDELITGGDFLIKNLKMNKVTAIQREIGLQPVLCFGNSSGDAAMANYTITNNPYKSGAYLLCCDDLERENGNQKKADDMRASCEKNGWTAVSMKNDWTTIYGDGVEYIKNTQ